MSSISDLLPAKLSSIKDILEKIESKLDDI